MSPHWQIGLAGRRPPRLPEVVICMDVAVRLPTQLYGWAVRILDLASAPAKPVSTFGSRSFSIAGLLAGDDAHVATVHLGPGGLIGRHPTATTQLLVVMTGEATVSGEDEPAVTIGPGHAALWQPGELHETRTQSGLVALVIEGQLDVHHRC